ncbi:MAG: helix-turn-helix domain-containing protein [Acidilobaceae archaeon]|nr:helix-turn-helix domain-containing protein [Acidilobaceae archaeon]MCX8165894.1 helix-turn-helix domain-containing protein [Acidilobaceae archaeon]MDW7974536.1 helix-turn-helix domain-containing protein [Sulfolobales archaeon]
MEEDYVVTIVAKRIAGDIVYGEDPGASLRKWRDYFEVSQAELARVVRVSTSVISDYEKGRRVPGIKFVKRYVNGLLELDRLKGWRKLTAIVSSMGIVPGVVIDMMEFSRPLALDELTEAVKGVKLNPEVGSDKVVYGYTIVDSINAILSLTGIQFSVLFGMTPERVIVFTKVQAGRSPMVAVRVSPVKPGVVVIHGPKGSIDPLAIELARRDGVPLILSLAENIEELKSRLRALTAGGSTSHQLI